MMDERTNDDGSSAPRPSRIAIVEDDHSIRAHFIDIITDAPSLDLAGVAGTLAKGRGLVDLQPDLFLLDIGLPDGSGLDIIPDIKAGCRAKVLVITNFGDRETVVAAIEAGADGYLLKDSTADSILDGLQVTLDGGAPISAAAAVYLLQKLRKTGDAPAPAAEEPVLTPREVELLQQFAKGESYKTAARMLGISPLTVGNHVKSIYRKLAVNSRGEAVYAAMKSGKLKLD
jgi:DNA-binding NarL/FixJ family response regulator